jgi:predicted metal-dependent HD superfamily phosphohydrolase
MDTQLDVLGSLKALYGRVGSTASRDTGLVELLVSELAGHYTGRFYHSLQHIAECLEEFSEVKGLCENPDTVEMALWYHDIIYLSNDNTCVRLSANKALFDCIRLGVGNDFADTVHKLILCTDLHAEQDGDGAIVCDIDLSILGRDWERFSEYESQIRKEYSSFSDAQFYSGRFFVLDKSQRRKSIFTTPHFISKYEGTARANLARSLMKLRGHCA